MVQVQVGYRLADHVGAQPSAPDGPRPDEPQGGLIQGKAAGGRGVLEVEDGQDAVENGVGQQGQGQQAQQEKGRNEPAVP